MNVSNGQSAHWERRTTCHLINQCFFFLFMPLILRQYNDVINKIIFIFIIFINYFYFFFIIHFIQWVVDASLEQLVSSGYISNAVHAQCRYNELRATDSPWYWIEVRDNLCSLSENETSFRWIYAWIVESAMLEKKLYQDKYLKIVVLLYPSIN